MAPSHRWEFRGLDINPYSTYFILWFLPVCSTEVKGKDNATHVRVLSLFCDRSDVPLIAHDKQKHKCFLHPWIFYARNCYPCAYFVQVWSLYQKKESKWQSSLAEKINVRGWEYWLVMPVKLSPGYYYKDFPPKDKEVLWNQNKQKKITDESSLDCAPLKHLFLKMWWELKTEQGGSRLSLPMLGSNVTRGKFLNPAMFTLEKTFNQENSKQSDQRLPKEKLNTP